MYVARGFVTHNSLVTLPCDTRTFSIILNECATSHHSVAAAACTHNPLATYTHLFSHLERKVTDHITIAAAATGMKQAPAPAASAACRAGPSAVVLRA